MEPIITIAEETDSKQKINIILDETLDYTILLCKAYISYIYTTQKTEGLSDIEMILRRCHELSVKPDKEKKRAVILNLLGQVISKKPEKNLQLALMYFRESIKLGEELKVREHLAKFHTAMGQALLEHGDIEQAAEKFRIGFEIDEELKNSWDLIQIIPKLRQALVQLDKHEEAITYCQRALEIAIASQNQNLIELCNELLNPNPSKQGTVKFIKRNKQGKLYGFIVPDDGSSDIYFREDFIECISKLRKGSRVEVEVKEEETGFSAKSLRILTR